MKKKDLEVKVKVKRPKAIKSNEVSELDKLTELQKAYVINEFLTKNPAGIDILVKMMGQGEAIKPKEEIPKIVKKEKIDVPKIIKQELQENPDLFVLNMEKEYCILIKKKTETVLRTLCAGTMNPVETQKDITIFNCFSLYWPLTKSSKIDGKLTSLMQHGFPVHTVETEYDIHKAIEQA